MQCQPRFRSSRSGLDVSNAQLVVLGRDVSGELVNGETAGVDDARSSANDGAHA
jgi:hypothetical protein